MNREETPVVRNIFIAIMLTTIIAGYDIARGNEKLEVKAQEVQVVISTPTSTPEATTKAHTLVFDNPVRQYVYDKFGDDFNRAFDIIDCESKWNTKAHNDNTTWGGVGQDRGLWQINNKYHPINDECAYDYKCATDYAYRMYKNDNYQFNRWTCGSK